MTTTITQLRNVGRMATGPLRDRGLRETLRSLRLVWAARLREKAEGFDARFGTDTERRFRLADLAATGPDVPSLWRYYPTLRGDFEPIVRALPAHPEDYAFVDLGSGKGRVLLMAADWPFRRIIGVELSPALHRIAQQNIALYRSPTQRCTRFELLCTDAVAWEPPAENLVVYLFQPFPEDTLLQVLENLRASVERTPRRLIIAYLNPVFERAILDSGWLRPLRRVLPAGPQEFGWGLYANANVRA